MAIETLRKRQLINKLIGKENYDNIQEPAKQYHDELIKLEHEYVPTAQFQSLESFILLILNEMQINKNISANMNTSEFVQNFINYCKDYIADVKANWEEDETTPILYQGGNMATPTTDILKEELIDEPILRVGGFMKNIRKKLANKFQNYAKHNSKHESFKGSGGDPRYLKTYIDLRDYDDEDESSQSYEYEPLPSIEDGRIPGDHSFDDVEWDMMKSEMQEGIDNADFHDMKVVDYRDYDPDKDNITDYKNGIIQPPREWWQAPRYTSNSTKEKHYDRDQAQAEYEAEKEYGQYEDIESQYDNQLNKDEQQRKEMQDYNEYNHKSGWRAQKYYTPDGYKRLKDM